MKGNADIKNKDAKRAKLHVKTVSKGSVLFMP